MMNRRNRAEGGIVALITILVVMGAMMLAVLGLAVRFGIIALALLAVIWLIGLMFGFSLGDVFGLFTGGE